MANTKVGGVKAYGLTASGKPRYRPLKSELIAALPPVLAEQDTPGYTRYEPVDAWVYGDDFYVIVEVAQETADPRFTSRHGTRATKNRGCSGPLCRKALRDSLYGGAKSAQLIRLEELLNRLQAAHDTEYFSSLTNEEKSKLSEALSKYVTSAQQTLELVSLSQA